MKTTKILIAIALALTLICALGAPAFADFMSPYGYVQVNPDGSRTLYLPDGSYMIQYPDGSIVSHDPSSGVTSVTTDKTDITTYNPDGSVYHENGNGYSEYHDSFGYSMTEYPDGSYDVEENGVLNHYDRFGNLIGMQVDNGSYYETIF